MDATLDDSGQYASEHRKILTDLNHSTALTHSLTTPMDELEVM